MTLGAPLFCPCRDGASYFDNRLSILLHVLGPISSTTKSKIERSFPGTFKGPDSHSLNLKNTLYSSTQQFLEDRWSLNVRSFLYNIINLTFE